jgi:Heparinase II/III-like protein
MSDSKISWYCHRLKAMDLSEMAGHVHKRWRQWMDRRGVPAWTGPELSPEKSFPRLPDPARAPSALREALARDAQVILAGRWRAFGHLELAVEDPPLWHKDYLAGIDLSTNESAFKLDHRSLPGGADIKLIWELSRWHALVRLAMAAYVLGMEEAGRKCLNWLEDWVRHNPPFRGWNWTSPLEAGMRLIQFTWIDALLDGFGSAATASQSGAAGSGARNQDRAGDDESGFRIEWQKAMEALRRKLLPAHVWFVWRYQSFGSSANNHLLGELAGLIVAAARWPALERWGTPLSDLQTHWEREVLAQFAEDGGNREQALNYQLFSWEFCWQTRAALLARGRTIRAEVETRLIRAADFFAAVQADRDPWDYGDSDNAIVTPFVAEESQAVTEWHDWFNAPDSSPALTYWWGDPPGPEADQSRVQRLRDWLIYPESGQAVCWAGDWNLRWDVSPLGYLSTAAHGHLDALHLSLWFMGVAMVVDPGTGAYYADPAVREYLASWEAHNGPHPSGLDFPKRLGPFLWSEHHARPELKSDPGGGLLGTLILPDGRVERKVTRLEEQDGWNIDDQFVPNRTDSDAEFFVCWQFAPGTRLEKINERRFWLRRQGVSLVAGFDAAWWKAEIFDPESEPEAPSLYLGNPSSGSLAGICAPSFRRLARGPRVRLMARGHNPCLFRTTFLASADS